MYHPGSNYRITEELRRRRQDAAIAEMQAKHARLEEALIGATIEGIEDDGDNFTIRYFNPATNKHGRIVINGGDLAVGVGNDEKEW